MPAEEPDVDPARVPEATGVGIDRLPEAEERLQSLFQTLRLWNRGPGLEREGRERRAQLTARLGAAFTLDPGRRHTHQAARSERIRRWRVQL